MAEKSGRNSGGNRRGQQQPSRLQQRAPASIQISPVSSWNVAIPLLSPLVQSPTSPNEMISKSLSKEESRRNSPPTETQTKPPVIYKKWQHLTAAPFCYESTPFVPFVCSESRIDDLGLCRRSSTSNGVR